MNLDDRLITSMHNTILKNNIAKDIEQQKEYNINKYSGHVNCSGPITIIIRVIFSNTCRVYIHYINTLYVIHIMHIVYNTLYIKYIK